MKALKCFKYQDLNIQNKLSRLIFSKFSNNAEKEIKYFIKDKSIYFNSKRLDKIPPVDIIMILLSGGGILSEIYKHHILAINLAALLTVWSIAKLRTMKVIKNTIQKMSYDPLLQKLEIKRYGAIETELLSLDSFKFNNLRKVSQNISLISLQLNDNKNYDLFLIENQSISSNKDLLMSFLSNNKEEILKYELFDESPNEK